MIRHNSQQLANQCALRPFGLDQGFLFENISNYSPSEQNSSLKQQHKSPSIFRNVSERYIRFKKSHRINKVFPDKSSQFKVAHERDLTKGKLFSFKQEEVISTDQNEGEQQFVSLQKHRHVQKEETDQIEQFETQNLVDASQSNTVYSCYLVKRFMTKLSTKRQQKLFFKAKHFGIVNDLASEKIYSLSEIQSNQSKKDASICCLNRRYFKSLLNKYVRYKNRLITDLSKLLKHVPLIYPQTMGKIIWDSILCLNLMYFFVVIPIEICFQNEIIQQHRHLTIFQMVFFLCDFLMKINTVYYEYGKPVANRLKIFNYYIQNGFYIDGLSIIALMIHFCGPRIYLILDLVLLLFYTQFKYFKTIIKHVEESLNLSELVQSVLDLIKLLFIMLFVEHIFSCLWYFIAIYKQQFNETNWLAVANLLDKSWEIQYLESFYFSTVTMLTIGYGDITPTNSLEKIVSIVFMLFACIQLSYSVNTVGQIINQMSQQKYEAQRKMRIINKYMNDNVVSFGLQYQVREYLKIYWQQQVVQECKEEEKILGNLSEKLRNNLIYEANNSVLTSCPLFKSHFTENTKVKLLKIMKQVVISPETVITSEIQQIGEPCLCYVQLGSLDVCLNQQSQQGIESFQKGMHFGLENFITGQTPHMQMSSQAFVKLIVITRSDFIREISEIPQDYEEFCMIKDQYMLNTVTKQAKCSSCQCTGHDVSICPLIHFVIDKEKVIKTHQFNSRQPSIVFHRSKKRQRNQFHSLFDLWTIQELSKIIQYQEEEYCYYYNRVNNLYQCDQSLLPLIDQFPNIAIKQSLLMNNQRPNGLNQGDSTPVTKNFQKIVGKVLYLLQIHGAKKFALTYSEVAKYRTEVVNFNANIQAQFKKLKNEEDDFIQHNCLKPKELDDINFLILKMNLINQQDQTQSLQFSTIFESQKDFCLYSPHNNIDKVIEVYNQQVPQPSVGHWFNQNPSSKSLYQRQNILRVSLTNYMLFPSEYFTKFCRKVKNNMKHSINVPKLNARLLFKRFKAQNYQQRMKSLSGQGQSIHDVGIQ